MRLVMIQCRVALISLHRRVKRGEGGFSLLEVVFSLALASLLILGATQVAMSASATQILAQQQDAAEQLAQGVLQSADATPWMQLGFTPTELGAASCTTYYVTGNEVCLNGSLFPNGYSGLSTNRPTPTSTVTVHNAQFHLITSITWPGYKGPVLASTNPLCAGSPNIPLSDAYGHKLVIVKVGWRSHGTLHQIALSSSRTPDLSQSEPTCG